MTALSFLNLALDHTTFLCSPRVKKILCYVVWNRILLGKPRGRELYRVFSPDGKNLMTFAISVGDDDPDEGREIKKTMQAFVQPTEPLASPSHVRKTLEDHKTSAFIQHLAYRTNDIFKFYAHLKRHGVNFITPILEDKNSDLLQVFTGELYAPGEPPSGLFFEFVQRKVTTELRVRLKEHHRETFFRDETFLGLYNIKESESQKNSATPFIDHELFSLIEQYIGNKRIQDITEKDIAFVKKIMEGYATL